MTFVPLEAEERSKQREIRWISLNGNPSSEKMTTVALVIGLKGMPMGKTLVGSLLQPRDYRVTKIRRKQIAVRIQYSA